MNIVALPFREKVLRWMLILTISTWLCPSALPAQGQFVVARLDNVNLRACPRLDCRVLETVSKGSSMEVIGLANLERIDGYGDNRWFEVRYNGAQYFVYGAVVVLNIQEALLPQAYTAYAWRGEVNVRMCPSLNCGIIFQLRMGEYSKVIGQTNTKQTVGSLGEHYWQIVEYRGRRGYVWGGLLLQTLDKLTVNQRQVPMRTSPNGNGRTVGYAHLGDQYPVIRQTIDSEVVRPYGRNFWYQIAPSRGNPVWVYGGYTSRKDQSAVDCQCVDFIKNKLSILGPTKHATDWGEVLVGGIAVSQNQNQIYLNYNRVYDPQKGDIAVFRHTHPEVHQEFGHVGLVSDIKVVNNTKMIEIKGANHPLPEAEWFTETGCFNVTNKWYQYTNDIEYYR